MVQVLYCAALRARGFAGAFQPCLPPDLSPMKSNLRLVLSLTLALFAAPVLAKGDAEAGKQRV